MPISECQQLGVKLVGKQSGNSVIGVPLKKRKFPLFQSASPPPQISSSPPGQPDLPQKEQSVLEPEASSLNAGGVTEVPVSINSCAKEDGERSLPDINMKLVPKSKDNIGSLPDRNIKSVPESASESSLSDSNIKMGPKIEGHHGSLPDGNSKLVSKSEDAVVSLCDRNIKVPKCEDSFESDIHRPSNLVSSSAGEEIVSKGKVIPENTSPLWRVPENEHLLAPKEPLRLTTSEGIGGEVKLMPSDNSAFRRVPGNTELPSALREPVGLSLESQTSGGIFQEQKKLDQCPLDLGLVYGTQKDVSSAEEQKNVPSNVKTESEVCSHPPANRSHWDLNKMMDTWEGSVGDQLPGGTDKLDLRVICKQESVKFPVERGREQESTHVISGKHTVVGSSNNLKLPSSSGLLGEHCDHQSHLRLQLNSYTGCESLIEAGPTSLSAKLNLVRESSDCNLPVKPMRDAGKLRLVDCKVIKTEPYDQGSQGCFRTSEEQKLKLVERRTVMTEPFIQCDQGLKKVDPSNLKFVDSRIVKCEPTEQVYKRELKMVEEPSSQLKLHSSSLEMPPNLGVSHEVSQIVMKTSDLVSSSVTSDGKDSGVTDSMLDNMQVTPSEGANPQSSRLILEDERHLNPPSNSEVAESDEEEKINISVEDDPYDSDYESDGVHNEGDAMPMQQNDDDDYEDGEVRDSLANGNVGICQEGETKNGDNGDSNNREAAEAGHSMAADVIAASCVESKDDKIEESNKTHSIIEQVSSHCNENNDKDNGTEPCLKESTVLEVPDTGSSKKKTTKAVRRVPKEHLGTDDGMKKPETLPDPAISEDRERVNDGPGETVSKQENGKGNNLTRQSNASHPKKEQSVNGGETIKDTNARGNRNRVINLARTANGSSSGRPRSTPGRSLRTERERYPDTSLRVDKLHPRGNRDESRIDGFRKYGRDRNQDQSAENSVSDSLHASGRGDKRLEMLRGDWKPDHDFNIEHYNSSSGFRVPRAKNTVTAATKLGPNGCVVAPDGTILTAGRSGRKLVGDELHNLHHLPSRRRRSPGGREGPVPPLSMPMARRALRDPSPDRCISGGGPDMVGMRHEGKFMRGLPDDMMDPLFSHPQPQFDDRVGDHFPFVRRERSISPIQRRGPLCIPSICSKSPPRSRSRSPRPWPLPRRRSPDGFDGIPELMRCRSPPIFRVERMRSPRQRPCFAEDMMGRRHGSPPFHHPIEMREIGPPRDHGHPRPFISHRSPTDRVMPRSFRRFDMIDSRDRTEGDEYFGPPQNTRFHEFPGDGCMEERRKGSERHGPVRSLRPYEVDADAGVFPYPVEGVSRPYRFCPEAEADFHERGSPRDLDGRVKNRLENPRRPRSIEEPEDSYRFVARGWQEDGFNEFARMKRGRF